MRARLRPQGPGGQGGKLNGVVFRKKHNRQVNREVESAMGVLKQTHWITVLAVACLAFSSCARQYRSGTAATTSSRYKSARNSAQTHSASKEKLNSKFESFDVFTTRAETIYGVTYTASVQSDGTFSIVIPASAVADLAYDTRFVVEATVTDVAGNVANATEDITTSVDALLIKLSIISIASLISTTGLFTLANANLVAIS